MSTTAPDHAAAWQDPDSRAADAGSHPSGELNPRPALSVTARVSALAGYAAFTVLAGTAVLSTTTCTSISSMGTA